MTTATATKPRVRKPRLSIEDKAEALLSNSAAWLRARDLANPLRCVGYLIPSLTEPGKYHLATPKGCDCLAAQAGRACCHRLAAELYVAQKREEAAAAATLASRLLDDDSSFVEWLDAQAEAERLAQVEQDMRDLYGDDAAATLCTACGFPTGGGDTLCIACRVVRSMGEAA